jgi:hypothetical protein
MTTTTRHFLGRQNDGTRVYVEISVNTSTDARTQTIDHRTTDSITRISISGFTIAKGRRWANSAGQILQDVLFVTWPAKGWNSRDLNSLASMWAYWHLNDMRADCNHKDDCDYKSGSAWLYEAPTAAALKEIARLQSLPTGNVPDEY